MNITDNDLKRVGKLLLRLLLFVVGLPLVVIAVLLVVAL